MLNKNDYFAITFLFSSLIKRLSRVFIVLLSTTIGAAVLVGMITLCYDIPRQLSKEFRFYGANMILLPANNHELMNFNDVKKGIEFIPSDQVVGVTPYRYVSVRSDLTPYTLVGVDFEQIKKTSPYWSVEGNYPINQNQIMIGTDIAHFAALSIGDVVPISGRTHNQSKFESEFTVSGIIKTGKNEDGLIFVDFNLLEALLGEELQTEVVELSVIATESKLNEYIAIIKNQNENVTPHLVKWITQSESLILGKLKALLYLVTVIILILTTICVATTMMTIVIERKQEIGLKKALGAENHQISKEFLMESAILGFIGGLTGSILGLFFAHFICIQVFDRVLSFDFYLIPITTFILMFVTVIACLIPVKNAIAIDPALVLRGE